MRLRVVLGSLAAVFVGFLPISTIWADEVTVPEEVRKVMVQLMTDTKLNAVMGFSGPVEGYKADGDPTTLELVFLSDRKQGPSHVSDDGEVIFLAPRTKDNAQQELITQAFYVRALKKMGLTTGSTAPAAPSAPEKPEKDR